MVVAFPVEYNCKECDLGLEFLTYDKDDKNKFRHITVDNYTGNEKKEIEKIKTVLEKNDLKVELVSRSGNNYVPLGTDGGKTVRMRILGKIIHKSKKYGTLTELLNAVNAILDENDCYCEYWSGFFHADPHYGAEYVTEERNSFEKDPQATIFIKREQIVGSFQL